MTSYGPQDRKALQGIRGIFDRYLALVTAQSFAGFDVTLMRSLQLVACSDAGTVAYTLAITPAFANLNGVMHGGAAGVIFDMCTTTALGPLARPGYWEFMGGVTRSLSVSYLRAVPVGVEVLVRAEVVQCGRMMAFIRGAMLSLDEKVVYCTAEHHKVYVPMKEEFKDVVVEWDGLWGDDGEENVKAKL